eukprot:5828137-Amphidinium_carterae.1
MPRLLNCHDERNLSYSSYQIAMSKGPKTFTVISAKPRFLCSAPSYDCWTQQLESLELLLGQSCLA